jgi:hypothetical protein
MDPETRTLLAGSVRALLESGEDPESLGWSVVVAEDARAAWEVWFTEQGHALASSNALDEVLLGQPSPRVAVAHPWPYDLLGAALQLRPGRPGGLVLGPLTHIDQVAIPVVDGDGVALQLVDTGQLATTATTSFDPSLDWCEVRAEPSSAPLLACDWEPAVAAVRRALAAEILGCADRMLAIAVAHTSHRVQYGKTIATFQAVRHRLAECSVHITSARRLLAVADDAWGAAAAKAAAGRAQRAVATQALQVCGAMGLTQEFILHRYVERAAVLDALYGGHRELTAALGNQLLQDEEPLPRVVDA